MWGRRGREGGGWNEGGKKETEREEREPGGLVLLLDLQLIQTKGLESGKWWCFC